MLAALAGSITSQLPQELKPAAETAINALKELAKTPTGKMADETPRKHAASRPKLAPKPCPNRARKTGTAAFAKHAASPANNGLKMPFFGCNLLSKGLGGMLA